MPHIVFEQISHLDFPKVSDGVEFSFIANSKHESKISVKVDGQEFLLTKKAKESSQINPLEILKADKATRPSKAYPIKKALNAFLDAYGVKTIFSNISNLKDNTKQSNKYLKEIDYFLNDFNTQKEIWVEIGFGSGRHLLHQAKKNPDILLIGLEIHTPSIEQVLKQIELQEISNVLILNYDARLFLEFLKSNSVGKIFVHFPVPWEKKPHRRVYSKEFVDEALRVLNMDGTLELRTDSREYFDFALSILTNLTQCHIDIDINKDLDISSKYEDRWKKMGKNIYDLILHNNTISPVQNIESSFEFDKINIEKIKDTLPKKSLVEEDYFVHFENFYSINDNSALIEVTFGSFNRPVSKYIYINDLQPSYFQGKPLITKANIKAHEKIKAILSND
ncbi:tRNA (guanosine(46)-N7)-methyltransferase TrmB [Arcobacter sp. FWKO B]|uniref:tRNA (guanosine(46)-N7)-methyltransferase TrmB n=1 Tax=Arcobacter sp. FWKO B TaxID=2593672 RepID=UPI0018A4215C|nr:tRNA (guanosine(46)-N7)-methyltransferase TrmB [Arcobacter sp. FWKO B]QOG11170.1 tRNA (guanosine(46)-N7)-methyltransferase TrmB [Arcobacter sp. FWKO B]